MNRSMTTLLVLALVGAAIAGCNSSTQDAAERRTASAFVVPALHDRPAGLDDKEFAKVRKNYEGLRTRINANERDVEALVGMAQLFMQEGRVTGRHHEYLPGAQALLDHALSVDPQSFAVTATKASLLMTLHRFAEAKTMAERAVGANPYSAYAYGVLCDAHVELGEYDDAVKACDRMLAIRPDLSSYARASYVRELNGDRPGALEAMRMAADAGQFGHEDRAWALYNLGNLYLNAGKLDTAEYIYRGILEERPNYAFALSGQASVAGARGNYADAAELLVRATQLSPEHLFVEQLSDVYVAMGDSAGTAALESKAIDAFTQHEKGGWNIDREYAQYCANHNRDLAGALTRAKREYERRPNNIDAADTYAWTLYKNGRAAEARTYADQAVRMNPANPMLHYRAGLVYTAAGDRAKGAAQLHQAIAQNPHLPPTVLAEAHAALAGSPAGTGTMAAR